MARLLIGTVKLGEEQQKAVGRFLTETAQNYVEFNHHSTIEAFTKHLIGVYQHFLDTGFDSLRELPSTCLGEYSWSFPLVLKHCRNYNDIFILSDVLLCSVVEYFDELCLILKSP